MTCSMMEIIKIKSQNTNKVIIKNAYGIGLKVEVIVNGATIMANSVRLSKEHELKPLITLEFFADELTIENVDETETAVT